MRGTITAVTGEAAAWDPAAQDRFRELAGSQFLRTEGDVAVVRTQAGPEALIHPGYFVVLPDGAVDGGARFAGPDRVEAEAR